MTLNRFEAWMLRRIARIVVRQGWHRAKIIKFYSILAYEARQEFTEDNTATLNSFLRECHDESIAPSNYEANKKSAVNKVLYGKGRSKAEKTKRGSALTQRD